MTIRRYAVLAIVALFTFSCNNAGQQAEGKSDSTVSTGATMYFGGDIITMEGDSAQYVESIVVKDGRILFAGSKDEAMKVAGEGHQMVDLKGQTLLPSFIDGHGHYIQSLSVANQCNLYPPPNGPGSSPEAIVEALKKFVAEKQIPKGAIIQAYGYDENMMPKGKELNRDHLDAAFPDNIVIVGHVSMHGAVMNSVALKKFGYDASYKTPAGGVVVRKPGTNEPYGLIMETAYLEAYAQLPKVALDQEDEATRAGQLMYAASGITLAHEGATHLADLQTIKRAADSGVNLIDVVAFPFMTDLEGIMKEFPIDTWGKFTKGVKIGGVKITADGSPQGKTAFFSTPYLTGGPGGEKNWRGEPTMPQEELNKLVKQVYTWGVPLINHTNGDSTIGMFLKAIELARGGDYSKPWNVTTIHTQFVRRDQLVKFPVLKIRPSFYTEHTFYFSDANRKNRGEKQAAYLSPMRDAIDIGLHPTNHTDFYVAPLDQMFMMWTAVNRPTRSGGVLGADQRITPYEALKSQTIWAAEQYDEQENRGTLKVGKLADMVILDKNPLKVDPKTLKDLKVIETIKEGKSIYKAQ
jgi:predicted amidohydrolase YtcJ